MDSAQWSRLQEIFHRALELDLDDQTTFLEEACAGDPDLRTAVGRLLQEDLRSMRSVQAAVRDSTARLFGGDGGDIAGQEVGPYRVSRLLGSGGMGEVYEAEQIRPIRRKVALKLIKWGMDTRQVLARFESERQALALMNHPNIAQVYDAGATEKGRPYFAMELVPGLTLHAFCDRHRLTVRQRLDLFLGVCDGVLHAHQKGVIHRDLKPSNILVSNEYGQPLPKIIDFGIAKATTQRLTEETVFTQTGLLIGTPEYMSPEQTDPLKADIDTRSDVYSLGAILYELLVGAHPQDSLGFRRGGMEGIRRHVREAHIPRPSTRLRQLGQQAGLSARNRRTTTVALRKQLMGDLDWIVLRAMEKERERRYASVGDLAADIRRHLQEEPVLARPPRTGYRIRKWVRRNKIATVAGLSVVLALSVGLTAATYGLFEARRATLEAERDAATARQVSSFVAGMFEVSSPEMSLGEELKARQILDWGSRRLRDTLKDQPRVRARLMETVGTVYRNLGLFSEAEPLLRESAETNRRLLGAEHPDTLQSNDQLGFLYLKQFRYEEAESTLSETVDAQKRVLGDDHPATIQTMFHLALLTEARGRNDDATRLHEEVLRARRRVLGEDHPDTLESKLVLGWLYWHTGQGAKSRPITLEALEGSRRVLGENHPRTLSIIDAMAAMTLDEVESEKLYRTALEGRRRVLGPDHPDTLNTQYKLSTNLKDQGRLREATLLLAEVVEQARRILGTENVLTGLFENGLGEDYHELGMYPEAEELYANLTEKTQPIGPDAHPFTFAYVAYRAWVYIDEGRVADAEKMTRDALGRARGILGDDHICTLIIQRQLAYIDWLMGQEEEAERLLLEGMATAEASHGAEHQETLVWMNELAQFRLRTNRLDEAERLYLEVLRRADSLYAVEGPTYSDDPHWGLALVYRKLGRKAEAASHFRKSLDLSRHAYGENSPRYRFHQARFEALSGREEQAIALLQEALEGGFGGNAVALATDLASLHGVREFEEMVKEVKAGWKSSGKPYR